MTVLSENKDVAHAGNKTKIAEVLSDDSFDLQPCRLCVSLEEETINIYEKMEGDVYIYDAIMKCIQPLKIEKHDKLPKEICLSCLEIIKEYYKFREVCLGMDEKQREIAELESSSSDIDSDVDFPNAFKPVITNDATKAEKDIHLLSDDKRSEVDKKFDSVEEELRRILEGQLTEDQINAENIIIAVENDEDSNKKTQVSKVSPHRLPIIIKQNKINLSKGVKRKGNAIKEDSGVFKIKLEENEICLPKGIKVKTTDNFCSKTGSFSANYLTYIFDSEFCLVDNYLFEFRLCKGSTRTLRCIYPACTAVAMQNREGPESFTSEVIVQTPHTHKPPSQQDRKKQMCYCLMRRLIQSDQSLNFKSIYEEICALDPEIRSLIPLKNVVNEICRHQLTTTLPQVQSFEEFYDLIEDDRFQRIHFTSNHKQFYQGKLMTSDGTRAIIFANVDVVEKETHSKLMYVDASFRINAIEDFPYWLVTILVWVEDSYYPIVFALVSRKTQEIFRKVFEYVHDVVAPNLRPDEIVTDYEANLYYALGETYLESHIGGSVYYYTQNIYKKLCSLNLSREVETDSSLRNIYHMLLMLPLLPVNTILDGLINIEIQASELNVRETAEPLLHYIHTEWIEKVTPELFCVHRLENRINENVIAPFKKLRDLLMVSKGKGIKHKCRITFLVEKIVELEAFLRNIYSSPNKKSFGRDLSSGQKKNVLKAWQYIECHPRININTFFTKVFGYLKCMENQLWVWGFYRYTTNEEDELINAENFTMNIVDQVDENDESAHEIYVQQVDENMEPHNPIVMEAVVDECGELVMQINCKNSTEEHNLK